MIIKFFKNQVNLCLRLCYVEESPKNMRYLKNVSINETIINLKKKIELIVGLPIDMQKLWYLDETELQSHKTLKYYDIVEGAEISVDTYTMWKHLLISVYKSNWDMLIQKGVSDKLPHLKRLNKSQKDAVIYERAFVALFIAAQIGNVEFSKKIIQKFGKRILEATTQIGRTVLHSATVAGTEDMIKLFLNEGSNLDICDKDGLNAINLAGMFDRKFVERMLQKYRWENRAKQVQMKRDSILAPHQKCDSNQKYYYQGKHAQQYSINLNLSQKTLQKSLKRKNRNQAIKSNSYATRYVAGESIPIQSGHTSRLSQVSISTAEYLKLRSNRLQVLKSKEENQIEDLFYTDSDETVVNLDKKKPAQKNVKTKKKPKINKIKYNQTRNENRFVSKSFLCVKKDEKSIKISSNGLLSMNVSNAPKDQQLISYVLNKNKNMLQNNYDLNNENSENPHSKILKVRNMELIKIAQQLHTSYLN
ncbi:Ankyrin repeat domain-containing protein 60 [Intoshia linei]|uniref:Ankyrin repeat domain-containing protein 60 n=1 Tax=Intoshia linei TaxID=1819745 RepID=A0A177BEL3_9BILA|nr:Ankyrin repeat domain-containing protein 60 [Intoshia linei]